MEGNGPDREDQAMSRNASCPGETMALSERIADFAAGASYDSIPGEVVDQAREQILDTLAVAWAGTGADGVPQALSLVEAEGGAPAAAFWGLGRQGTAVQAAFLNGLSSAALDYDNVHVPAMSHSAIVVLPAALALAEQRRASGREFLAAFVVGNEVLCRLGMSSTARSGWFYTSTHGVFGAAVAGAKVSGLGAQGVADALGIALSHAAGTQQTNVEQKLTKRMQSAFAARNGTFSAQLAALGVSAPRESLDGKFGFYAKYDGGDPSVVTDGLGSEYAFVNATFKKFPSCACNHAAIEATLRLRREHGIAASDVERVDVSISPFMSRLVGAPYDPGANPQVAAQFSVRYSIASAILRGHLDLSDIEPAAARDPVAQALARAVHVTVRDDLDSPDKLPAEVAVRMRDGRVLACRVDDLPGSPAAPFTAAEANDKFLHCTSRGVAPLSPQRAAQLRERIANLESVEDMSTFFRDL